MGSAAVSSRHRKPASVSDGGDPEHRDEGRVEPLVALALVHEELERQESDHHEDDAGGVDPAGLAQVRRIEEDRAGREEPEDTDGHVDVERPAPRPVVRDPAAQRRPEDRRHHDPHAPDGHRHAPLTKREDLPHDGLGHRHERAAADALQDARDDQRVQVRREPAQHRRPRERHGADQEEALAPEDAREPARGGQDHRVGREVRGQHPRDLVHARRERALHVGQRDVDDGDVEHLHDGDRHDRCRDRPPPDRADRWLGLRRRGARVVGAAHRATGSKDALTWDRRPSDTPGSARRGAP